MKYDPQKNSLGCWEDALAGKRLRIQADGMEAANRDGPAPTRKPNYATLLPDEETGVLYIIDWKTGLRLYKYGGCEICGTSNWGWSKQPHPRCRHCMTPERNDNEEPGF